MKALEYFSTRYRTIAHHIIGKFSTEIFDEKKNEIYLSIENKIHEFIWAIDPNMRYK